MYVRAYYTSVQTLATVGYGDNAPVNNKEVIKNIFKKSNYRFLSKLYSF